MNTLGKAIQNDRQALGLSQQELADKVGVTQQAIARWELDQSVPRKSKHEKLVQELEIACGKINRPAEVTNAARPTPTFISDRLTELMREIGREKFKNHDAEERYNAIMDLWKRVSSLPQQIIPGQELTLVENDLLSLAKELDESPALRGKGREVFGPDPSEDAVKKYLAANAMKDFDYGQWARRCRELLWEEYNKQRGYDLKNIGTAPSLTPELDQINTLRNNLHSSLWGNLNVSVERGINRRNYDYFSNHVVAEIKLLHSHRPPSFNINAYAPEVVSLMLAKTMSFGQHKEYLLLLVYEDITRYDDMSFRLIGLQHDCSSLGVRTVLLKSFAQAAWVIQEIEGKATGAKFITPHDKTDQSPR
jgi:transcriptional regulator with XRE-family HTH domain